MDDDKLISTNCLDLVDSISLFNIDDMRKQYKQAIQQKHNTNIGSDNSTA